MPTATAEKPAAAKAATPVAASVAAPAPQVATAPAQKRTVVTTPPTGMHVDRVSSFGVEDVAKIAVYDSVEAINKDANDANAARDLANLYMRQKEGLVKYRRYVSDAIEDILGFKMLTKNVKKKDAEGNEKVVTAPDETDSEHFDRFKTAVMKGEFKHPSFVGTSEEAFDLSWTKWSDDNIGIVVVSSKESARAAAEKTPPKYAVKNAESIFSDTDASGAKKPLGLSARLSKWEKTFKDEGITYEDFQTKPADGTEQAVATARALNLTRLAWAIKAREDAKALKEYA